MRWKGHRKDSVPLHLFDGWSSEEDYLSHFWLRHLFYGWSRKEDHTSFDFADASLQ